MDSVQHKKSIELLIKYKELFLDKEEQEKRNNYLYIATTERISTLPLLAIILSLSLGSLNTIHHLLFVITLDCVSFQKIFLCF